MDTKKKSENMIDLVNHIMDRLDVLEKFHCTAKSQLDSLSFRLSSLESIYKKRDFHENARHRHGFPFGCRAKLLSGSYQRFYFKDMETMDAFKNKLASCKTYQEQMSLVIDMKESGILAAKNF